MCGIVFAGCNVMSSRDTDFFETLLYCDIVRGDHSTGVYAGFSLDAKQPVEVEIRKAAVPADVFIRRPDMWDQVKEKRIPSPNNANATIVKNPKFLVGHNRYATMGEVVDKNAHPFQHGSVTLVHNGTLDNQSLLPDHQKFAVDSENIAYSIDKIGIEETIKKLNGKFTLVWFDAKDQTLNFIRNKDRPFHFMETASGDWFGASEEDMLMWLSKRTKGPTAKRHFEAEVGVQYVFEIANGVFRFKEERKHELPVFRYVYPVNTGLYSRGSNQWNNYDDDDGDSWRDYYDRRNSAFSSHGASRPTANGSQTQNRSQTIEETTKSRLNALLEDHGVAVQVGEGLFFEAFQWEAYPNSSGKGKMTGFMGQKDEYIEVQAPGVEADVFKEGCEYTGRILSCYVMNYVLHIIVADPKPRFKETTVTISDIVDQLAALPSPVDQPLPGYDRVITDKPVIALPAPVEDEVTEEDEDEAVVTITQDGTVLTKKEWESNGALNCCANCSSPILWGDAEDATIFEGNAYCADCVDDCNENNEEGKDEYGYPKGTGSDKPFIFKCVVCSQSMHVDLMSSEDGVCTMCHAAHKLTTISEKAVEPKPEPKPERRNVLSLHRHLQNGMRVTKPIWLKMNECWCCKERIPWEDAEKAHFMGGRTICEDCNNDLEVNRLPKGRKR